MALRTDQLETTPLTGNHAQDHVATNTQINQNTSDIATKAATTYVDAQITGAKARSSHTGTQLSATISDLLPTIDSRSDGRIATASIDALADVTITNPTNGQVLRWNGTTWINDTVASAGASVSTSSDSTYTGLNTFEQGIILKDSAANFWLLGVNTDGSLQTSLYYGGSFSFAFLAENSANYFASEDSLTYLAQEA